MFTGRKWDEYRSVGFLDAETVLTELNSKAVLVAC